MNDKVYKDTLETIMKLNDRLILMKNPGKIFCLYHGERAEVLSKNYTFNQHRIKMIVSGEEKIVPYDSLIYEKKA